MKRYLLDTGTAGDLIFRRRGVAERVRDTALHGSHVGICIPVLGELYAGLEYSSSRTRNVDRVRHGVARLRIWPFDTRAAEEYGRIFAALRRSGRTIEQVDMQVAAIALGLGNCTVVSCDNDLLAVPGLTVENWSTP